MAISVGDLGPVGLMKAIVNTFLAMAAVGIVLTWPEEFGTAKSLTELGVGLFFVCGAIEWAFRGWHKEMATKISESNRALVASGVLHLPYARQRLVVAETALAENGMAINNDNGDLSVRCFDAKQLEEVKRALQDPSHDPTRNPRIVSEAGLIFRPRP
jgi:hypothetical protein